ncbi:MAG: EVE domain-containing protein [Bacteroidales bacterium]|jgi:Fe-S-cluster-containing hydrogenase component 2|nr:EVE domain-containing protein [Bacteroidales bacterium]
MSIPTSRVKESGEIKTDKDLCTGCAKCVEVCKDFSLTIKDHKACMSDNPIFGCIGCRHCMAVCPTGAIQINGRTISPVDLFDLPDVKEAANYEQLHNLFSRRRSIREFIDKPVESEAEKKYWIDANEREGKKLRVKMKIVKNLLNRPLLKEGILKTNGLQMMRIIRNPRGANFYVTPDEWNIIKGLISQ